MSEPRLTMLALIKIHRERVRQVEKEGWSEDHDDAWKAGELARAATCYCMVSNADPEWFDQDIRHYWPWSDDWWKPGDEERNIVKAAALLVAELERILREKARKSLDADGIPYD